MRNYMVGGGVVPQREKQIDSYNEVWKRRMVNTSVF